MNKYQIDVIQTVNTTYRKFIEYNSKEEARDIVEADCIDLDDYEIIYDDYIGEYIEIEEIK